MRQLTLKTALALGVGLTALGTWSAVQAQDAPGGSARQRPWAGHSAAARAGNYPARADPAGGCSDASRHDGRSGRSRSGRACCPTAELQAPVQRVD